MTEIKTENIGGAVVDIWNPSGEVNPPRVSILMIHGIFVGGWVFKNWASFLREKGIRVYVIRDLREGEDLKKVDINTYVKKIIAIVDAITSDHQKVVILGHSMGGLLAQKTAEIIPKSINGLVLVESAPPKGISTMSYNRAVGLSTIVMVIKSVFPLLFNLPFKPDRKVNYEYSLHRCGSDEEKEIIFKRFTPESSRVIKQLVSSRLSVDEKRITCKSLIISGRYDRTLPPKIQRKIVKKFNSSYQEFPIGHMPMFEENKDKVIGEIYNWIFKLSE